MIDLEQNTIKLLIEAGALTLEELDDGKRLQKANGGSLKEALLEREYISEDDIEELKRATQLGVPYKRLRYMEQDKNATALMPANFALAKRVVPIKLEDSILQVATTNPLDINLIDDIRLITESEIQPVLSLEDDITDAIRRF